MSSEMRELIEAKIREWSAKTPDYARRNIERERCADELRALLARTEAGAVCRYCGDSGKVVNVAGAVVGVCAEHGDSVPVADGAVAWSVVRVGNQGAAYDPPNTHRAFTYEKQPGNVDASRLGRATDAAAAASAGDSIDRGLALLKELQAVGFGVFHIGPVAMQAKEAK